MTVSTFTDIYKSSSNTQPGINPVEFGISHDLISQEDDFSNRCRVFLDKILNGTKIDVSDYFDCDVIHNLILWVNGDYTNCDYDDDDYNNTDAIIDIKSFIQVVKSDPKYKEFLYNKTCYRGYFYKDEVKESTIGLFSYTTSKKKAKEFGDYISVVQPTDDGFFNIKYFLEKLFKLITFDLLKHILRYVAEDFFTWATDEDEILLTIDERKNETIIF